MIGVFTNADENLGENAVLAASATFNEASTGVGAPVAPAMLNPLGTQGFSLGFSQLGC